MPGNIQTIPLEVFENWPVPNYVDPVRRSWMPIYAGILQGVMTLMLSLRLWLRFNNRAGALGLDDILLIPAFLGATMFTTLVIMCCVRYGTDRHTWDVPLDEFEDSALAGAFLSEIAFLISTCCTKVSILLFYRRLTNGTYNKKWKWATIAAIVFTIVFCLAFMFVLVFQCRPTEAYWKSLTFNYTEDFVCADTKILNPISGSLSVLSDFYSVVLPMAMTRHFDIERRKKIALNAVFSLGLLVVAAGAIRTVYLTKLGYDYDITWFGFDVFVWAELELNLAIMCACAPALRVLFRQYFKEPISRAVQTASSRNRSANRSENRDSKNLDANSTHDTLDLSGTGDKKLLDTKKPSMGTVDEREIESFSSTTPTEPSIIKTPADFEAYALQNLEKHRADSHGRRPARFRDDYIMQSGPDASQGRWDDTQSAPQTQVNERQSPPYTQYQMPNTPQREWSQSPPPAQYERAAALQRQWSRSPPQAQYERATTPQRQWSGEQNFPHAQHERQDAPQRQWSEGQHLPQTQYERPDVPQRQWSEGQSPPYSQYERPRAPQRHWSERQNAPYTHFSRPHPPYVQGNGHGARLDSDSR